MILRNTRNNNIEHNEKLSLKKDGVTMIPNILNQQEIMEFKVLAQQSKFIEIKEKIISNYKIVKKLKNITSNNYLFQDYIWMIMKSNVHTCHRDNNGDFFNKEQKYPSYTVLIYLEEMDHCLDVIKGSHLSLWNNFIQLTDNTKHIACKPGSLIIFNANLVHTGSFNTKPDNMRIQMKWTNRYDLNSLKYYNNFNKYVDKPNSMPLTIRKIQKHLSCQFPFLSDMTQNTNISTSRGTSDKNVKIPLTQKIFSYLAYGNSDYYDLPDAIR